MLRSQRMLKKLDHKPRHARNNPCKCRCSRSNITLDSCNATFAIATYARSLARFLLWTQNRLADTGSHSIHHTALSQATFIIPGRLMIRHLRAYSSLRACSGRFNGDPANRLDHGTRILRERERSKGDARRHTPLSRDVFATGDMSNDPKPSPPPPPFLEYKQRAGYTGKQKQI